MEDFKILSKLTACLLIIMTLTQLTACGSKNLDVSANNMQINSNERQVFKWGVSHKEVMKNKSNKNGIWDTNALLYENEILPYIKDKNISGYVCDTQYIFEQDKLIAESYYMTAEKNSVDFIKDYNDIKEVLSQQYGEPYEEKEKWKENSDKESGLSHEDAILEAKLSLGARWLIDDDTDVTLVLVCVNDTLFFIVKYTPASQK